MRRCPSIRVMGSTTTLLLMVQALSIGEIVRDELKQTLDLLVPFEMLGALGQSDAALAAGGHEALSARILDLTLFQLERLEADRIGPRVGYDPPAAAAAPAEIAVVLQ